MRSVGGQQDVVNRAIQAAVRSCQNQPGKRILTGPTVPVQKFAPNCTGLVREKSVRSPKVRVFIED